MEEEDREGNGWTMRWSGRDWMQEIEYFPWGGQFFLKLGQQECVPQTCDATHVTRRKCRDTSHSSSDMYSCHKLMSFPCFYVVQ